jgi:hypothetical protein
MAAPFSELRHKNCHKNKKAGSTFKLWVTNSTKQLIPAYFPVHREQLINIKTNALCQRQAAAVVYGDCLPPHICLP